MSIHQLKPAAAANRLDAVRRCYRYANKASHHALGFCLKLAVAVYFLFAALFLTLRYAVLPNIDHYKGDVERVASRTIGRPVTISTIYASWKGLRPYLFLGGVAIHDRNGREALKLPGVAATFSWWTAASGKVSLQSLEISRPDLDIERDRDGKLYVGGMFIDLNKPGDGSAADWVLAQHEIVVRDGRIRWNDAKRAAPELVLDHITFALQNNWHRHRFALKATPPASFSAPLDVRAEFEHPAFARQVSDVSKWKGQLYADLRDTDLAAWKAYVDYPFDVWRGKGAVLAWLDFDHMKVVDLVADLSLHDVSMRLRQDLQPLNLVRLGGRVAMREGVTSGSLRDRLGFGAHGHAIGVTDFSLQTEDGMTLPPMTVTEAYYPAQKGQPQRTELQVTSLDLQALAHIVERLPLPDGQLRLLNDLAPRGQLKNFAAQWRGSYPQIASYSLKGQFSGLSLNAQPASEPGKEASTAGKENATVKVGIPGFDNLTGAVDATDKGGLIELTSQQASVDLPGVFKEPVLPFDQLSMHASWSFPARDQLQVDVRDLRFVQEGTTGSLHGRHVIPLSAAAGHALGTIDLAAHIDKVDIARIDRFLPLITPPALRGWLTGALQGGTLEDADLKLRGALDQFPFHTHGTEKPAGEFAVAGCIRDGKLIYAPGETGKDGKTPLWPELDAIDGTIAFDRTRMEIRASSARTHGAALSNVQAVVPDLLARETVLNVDGNAAAPLQELVGYVNDSPVAGWIGNMTDETRASGNAHLSLKLQMPLQRLTETRASGTLQFAGNTVLLQKILPPMQDVAGRLEFNEKGFALDGLRANFLGGQALVSGGTQKDGAIQVRAEGAFTSAGLHAAYAQPAMQRLADRISGAGNYAATIEVRNKLLNIVVDSTLRGVGLDFPAPLRKAAADSMPLRVDLTSLPADEAGNARDELKMTLGASLAARYAREKAPARDAFWHVTRGGIGVNTPVPQPDAGGLIANINLKSLNIDAWNRVVSSIAGEGSDAGAGGGSGSGSDPEVMQYIEPDILAARADEMVVAGKKLDNVVVGASRQKDIWQANIDSDQASGYLTWNASSAAGGKATARLTSLVIPQSAASDVGELLEGKSTTTQIPALDVIAEKFELSGKKLGRLELVADNEVSGGAREWRIGKLSIANPDGELQATGKWSTRNGDSLSKLSYTLDIANSGRLLERLGFPNVIRGGKGKMQGDLSWKGLPFSFDLPTLSGQFKLDIASGQFLKEDAGAAKLLGVLSLQSLPRRLTLDFRDVFSQGFAFDGISAAAHIANGVAKTDNFKMRGVNATVLMDGSVDIARESQNLHVVIIPEINAGVASVVYALAVNPVIGVGSFLAQLFLHDPLSKAFTFEYNLTGTWADPVFKKLERRPNGTAAPAQTNSNDKAG